MKTIIQSESSECGLACLAMILNHYGNHTQLAELRSRFAISLKGATLAQIMRHANALELNARPLRLELDELNKLALPCILHWNLNHFIVLRKIKKSILGNPVLLLSDPAVGDQCLSIDEASNHFTGVALEIKPNARFELKKEPKVISVRRLIGPIFGIKGAIIQILILSLALEGFAIISPLFNQFVIDQVIVSGDQQLLVVLVFGFGLLLITQNIITLARSWFLTRWSMAISLQWSARIFAHLLRVPISYFEKRHLGDIVSRFGSIASIQNTLTSMFVESALDGLMALLALGMMILYSGILTALVIGAVFLYALIRAVFYQPFKDASKERLILSARENGHFLESMRAITPLKLFGREADRLYRWQNLKIDVQNRDIKTQKLSILFKTGNALIFGVQNLLMFYFGAKFVMSNSLTVGMLMAFASYASTFTTKISNLIDLAVNLKMLGLHAERLSDIALEPAEEFDRYEYDVGTIDAVITLKNISFRYAEGEPWVLKSINLTIPNGQSIALVGPSGCGKTTLCKIILGLLIPTEGDVLIGGVPISQLGIQSYRKLVGTVMQDDQLLAGSIAENIAFFDTSISMEMVESCAKLASIHTEISSMPMGYHTLVGDMGSSLSGGQKQRVLLARALYKKPKILALDEATSHLDVTNEKLVNSALANLDLTRIIVAHRPETINSTERIIRLGGGQLTGDSINASSFDISVSA